MESTTKTDTMSEMEVDKSDARLADAVVVLSLGGGEFVSGLVERTAGNPPQPALVIGRQG